MNTNTRKPRFKSIKIEKESQIKSLCYELENCKLELKKLSSLIKYTDSDILKKSLKRDFKACNIKKSYLVEMLEKLGFKIKKRGRPKKINKKNYSDTHMKFTAMLAPENFIYLKQLKQDKKITNISAFLDTLIEKYAKDNPL